MTYADVKIRKEHAQALRELAMRTNVKIADVVALWPRCPKCGGLLIGVEEGAVVCSNCRRGYALAERA
jgi:ribosomal protein S27AE